MPTYFAPRRNKNLLAFDCDECCRAEKCYCGCTVDGKCHGHKK